MRPECECPVCWIEAYGIDKLDGRTLIILREVLEVQMLHLQYLNREYKLAGTPDEFPLTNHRGDSLEHWINAIKQELEKR